MCIRDSSYLEQGEQAYCRMGAQLVATDAVSPSVMACVSPASAPGFVRVGVADGAEDGNVAGKDHQGAWFHYQAPAVTLAVHPPVGDVGGGALVRVVGRELVSLEEPCYSNKNAGKGEDKMWIDTIPDEQPKPESHLEQVPRRCPCLLYTSPSPRD